MFTRLYFPSDTLITVSLALSGLAGSVIFKSAPCWSKSAASPFSKNTADPAVPESPLAVIVPDSGHVRMCK